jgi:uncharacterized protein YecT (DUF1311 family)
MRKLVSAVVVAAAFAIGLANAQVPAKPGMNAITNGAVGIATTSATTAAKATVSSNAPLGALNECYNAIGDQPRTALQSCLEGKLREARSQMNSTYKKLEAQTKEIDSSATVKALASLHTSQKAFESFKDAQCLWVGDSVMGGSGSGDLFNSCEVDLVRWRTKQLAK